MTRSSAIIMPRVHNGINKHFADRDRNERENVFLCDSYSYEHGNKLYLRMSITENRTSKMPASRGKDRRDG